MPLSTYLNIFGASIGLMSALFFAFGALMMSPDKIGLISSSYWDENLHWRDSLAEQRADYICGAILLLLSFSCQLAGNFVPPAFTPYILNTFSCAISGIVGSFIILLLCFILLRRVIATKTIQKVQKMQEAGLITSMQEIAAPVSEI